LRVIPWLEQAAKRYARIRASQLRAGTPIGKVSNKLREFQPIDGLELEDWLPGSG